MTNLSVLKQILFSTILVLKLKLFGGGECNLTIHITIQPSALCMASSSLISPCTPPPLQDSHFVNAERNEKQFMNAAPQLIRALFVS
jgi:hypothetical protein